MTDCNAEGPSVDGPSAWRIAMTRIRGLTRLAGVDSQKKNLTPFFISANCLCLRNVLIRNNEVLAEKHHLITHIPPLRRVVQAVAE